MPPNKTPSLTRTVESQSRKAGRTWSAPSFSSIKGRTGVILARGHLGYPPLGCNRDVAPTILRSRTYHFAGLCRLQRIVTARWPLAVYVVWSQSSAIRWALAICAFSHTPSGPFLCSSSGRRDHSRADNCEPHVRFYVILRQTTIRGTSGPIELPLPKTPPKSSSGK